MNVSDQIEQCSIHVGSAAQALKLIIFALEDECISHITIQGAIEAVYFILDDQADQLSGLAAKL